MLKVAKRIRKTQRSADLDRLIEIFSPTLPQLYTCTDRLLKDRARSQVNQSRNRLKAYNTYWT